MWTRQEKQVAFWLVLAFVLLIYFFIPIAEDCHGNTYFTWSGFTNQTFENESGQTICTSLYHIYIVLAGFALIVIAKRVPGFARSIAYLSIGTVGLLVAPWWFLMGGVSWWYPVSANLISLAVAFSCGAVFAGIHYRNICRNLVPEWKYRTKVMFFALISVSIIILIATHTAVLLFTSLLIYVAFAVLPFGLMGIIDASSEGSTRTKPSFVVVIVWFCVNLLLARFLQHINEFPSEIPLIVMYFRYVFITLSSFMAITIGMIDLLRIRLLGKEPETATTGSIQGTTP